MHAMNDRSAGRGPPGGDYVHMHRVPVARKMGKGDLVGFREGPAGYQFFRHVEKDAF